MSNPAFRGVGVSVDVPLPMSLERIASDTASDYAAMRRLVTNGIRNSLPVLWEGAVTKFTLADTPLDGSFQVGVSALPIQRSSFFNDVDGFLVRLELVRLSESAEIARYNRGSEARELAAYAYCDVDPSVDEEIHKRVTLPRLFLSAAKQIPLFGSARFVSLPQFKFANDTLRVALLGEYIEPNLENYKAPVGFRYNDAAMLEIKGRWMAMEREKYSKGQWLKDALNDSVQKIAPAPPEAEPIQPPKDDMEGFVKQIEL